MKWFGESWGAPICALCDHGTTPEGELCERCQESIKLGDQGVTLPFISHMPTNPPEISYHLDCFLESLGIGGRSARPSKDPKGTD